MGRRRASRAPPCENNQRGKNHEEPDQRGIALRGMWITGVVRGRRGRGRRHTGETVDQRQDFAGIGGPAAVSADIVPVLDESVGFVAGGRGKTLPRRRKPDRNMRHRPFELRQHVALQVDVARVLGGEVHRDRKRAGQCCKLTLVGHGKRIAAVLGNVCGHADLRCKDERDRRRASTDGRARQLVRGRDARRHPDGCQRGKAGDRHRHACDEARGKQPLLERADDPGQRKTGQPLHPSGATRNGEIDHPGSDRKGQRDDRGGGAALGH